MGGQEGAGSARITHESQADRERRGQTDAGHPGGTAGSSDADDQPAPAARSTGEAYRCRDPLLQPPVSRDARLHMRAVKVQK